MKIDFNAGFRDIERIVSASANTEAVHDSEGVSFGKLLGNISPDRPQPVEIIQQNQVEEEQFFTPETAYQEPLASFKMPVPEQIIPELQPVLSSEIQNDEGVKKLSILDVRRLHNAKQVARMPREERLKSVKPLIEEAGRKQGVDPLLGMSIASAESSFNPLAVSRDGHHSKGLFQLLDSTGLDMKKRLATKEVYDPFNAEQNVNYGIAYLRYLHEIFSTATPLATGLETVPAANSASLEKLAVAAYNAGEGRVAAAQKRATRAGYDPSDYAQIESYLPESTRKYVKKVIASKISFEGLSEG